MASTATQAPRGDLWIIGLISMAHGFSHFFQLVIPPLFPFLRAEFDVSYTALGLVMTLFYTASGVAQTAAGFLVDHFGARRILLVGLALYGAAIAAVGLSPTFWAMFPLAALAGLGNSVFHPADFAILNARVGRNRLGRAYGLHSVAGNIGWALAPMASGGLAVLVGWRFALIALGCTGLAIAAYLAMREELLEPEHPAHQAHPAQAPGIAASLRLLMVTPILMCFAYFVLLAVAAIGLQSFAIPSIMKLYDTSFGLATTALTAFLLGGAAGVLVGGYLADRTTQHHRVAMTGLLFACAGIAVVTAAVVPAVLLPVLIGLVGFCAGSTTPSRDMLVRQATPAGASGKTYGFVYSGLDLGSALAPLPFGWFLDHDQPRWVFLLVLAALLLSVLTVLNMRRPALVPVPGE